MKPRKEGWGMGDVIRERIGISTMLHNRMLHTSFAPFYEFSYVSHE